MSNHRPPRRRPPAWPGSALVAWLAGLAFVLVTLVPGTASSEESESLERLRARVESFLADQLAEVDPRDLRIEVGQLDQRLRLQRCEHLPRATFAPGARPAGNTTVNLRCTAPASWSIFVPARVERYAEVVVVAGGLARGQVIGHADLRFERLDTATLTVGYFTTTATAIGQQARRALSPGQVLAPAHLSTPQLIERGQLVTLVAGRQGLNVRMSGEALASAAAGERVRVRNRSSNKIVEGVVDPSGLVIVGQ